MKKSLIGLLAAVCLHGAIAAEPAKMAAISVTLFKDRMEQSKMLVRATEGVESPVEIGKSIDYVKACESDVASTQRSKVTSQLQVGTFVQISPVTINEDKATIAINFNYVGLNGLSEVALADGCKVPIPDFETVAFGRLVVLRASEKFEYRTDLNGSKYLVVIRREEL